MSWEQFIAGGRQDTTLRDQLIAPTLPRVAACASRFAKAKRAPELRDDFEQAGCLAVVKCAATYEPDRRAKFWTWCWGQVRFAMFDVMRANDLSSRSMRTRIKKRSGAQLATCASWRPSTEEVDMAIGTSRHCVDIASTDEIEAADQYDENAFTRLCLQEDIRDIKERMARDLTMDQACLLYLHVMRGVKQTKLAKLLGVSRLAVNRTLKDAVKQLQRDPVEVALWEAVEELA